MERSPRSPAPPWLVLVPAALALAVYGRTGAFDFVAFDDNLYVYKNEAVLRGLTLDGVRWAFTSTLGGGWHPLTWLSHMLDATLFGPGPSGPHLVNAFLHAANGTLFFLFLRRATGSSWRSAAAAALFAVHPLHVESVAWVSERKDVLSTLFLFLALHGWVRYCRRPGTAPYLAVLLAFALGLLAKPMLVTFPLLLLVLDGWPLRRLPVPGREEGVLTAADEAPAEREAAGAEGTAGTAAPPGPTAAATAEGPSATSAAAAVPGEGGRDVEGGGEGGEEAADGGAFRPVPLRTLLLEKAPFLLLAVASASATLLAHSAKRVGHLPFPVRLANVPVSYATYLRKAFWPAGLSFFDPHPGLLPGAQGLTAGKVAASLLLLLAVTAAAFAWARRRPWFAAGWAWYLATLLPVIGLVQIGLQGTADRYTYVPLSGILVIVAWGGAEASERLRLPRAVPAAAAASVVLLLAACAWLQAGYWRDTSALAGRALEVRKDNWMALNILSIRAAEEGRMDDAVRHYGAALAVQPEFPRTGDGAGEPPSSHLPAGAAGQGDAEERARSLMLEGMHLSRMGREAEAAGRYRDVVRLFPWHAAARNNLGALLVRSGDLAGAEEQLREAVRLAPNDPSALSNLSVVLSKRGKGEEAVARARDAVRLRPDLVEGHHNLAAALEREGAYAEAVEQYREVLRISPGDPMAQERIAWIMRGGSKRH